MTDLTQKILSLDLKAALELNNAYAVSMEAKREADLHTEQRMEETQKLFKKQKDNEAKDLAKSLKEYQQKTLDNLQKKMENFDKNVEIDNSLEHLLALAKDRICR